MSHYRPLAAPYVSVPRTKRRADPHMGAATAIVGRTLPLAPPPPQVTRSVAILRGVATLCYAISVVLLFVAGQMLVARWVSGPGVVLAMLAFGIAYGWACRKLRL